MAFGSIVGLLAAGAWLPRFYLLAVVVAKALAGSRESLSNAEHQARDVV